MESVGGGWEGVNTVKTLTFERGEVHDPSPSSYGVATPELAPHKIMKNKMQRSWPCTLAEC